VSRKTKPRAEPGPRAAAVRKRSRLPWLAGGLSIVTLAGLAVALATRPPQRPNILLITIDTLRADHLGCYGYGPAATPVLDSLAARGVRFTAAIAHTPLTAPSHASILTGLLPLGHGVRDNGAFVLPTSPATLAELLQGDGYRTAAFVSGFPLDRRFGFARGFETYDDHLLRGRDRRRAPYVERTAEAPTRLASEWIRGTSDPWFVWVHYFDPHAPYEPPADLAGRFASRPYDGEIAFVDRELGRLLEIAAGHSRNTLVLVTSDHGESLGEHGEATHGVFVYDSTLRVPWIMAGPGISPGRVSPVVARGIDVAPTLLDYAGLQAPRAMQGRSLRPAADGQEMQDAPAYAESLFCKLNLGWAGLHAWRTARFKLIEAPRPELYDLAADPGEKRDVSAERGEVARALRAELLPALEARPLDAASVPGHEVRERLRALGYVSGAAPARASRRDPKDGIALVERLERGLAEARAHPALAVEELSAFLAVEPDAPLARRYRAIAFQAAGRFTDAVADIRALEAKGPLSLEDLTVLAESLRLAGRHDDALAALDRATALAPKAPEPALLRGRTLRAMGRGEEAGAALRRALVLDPASAEARRGLGEMALERGAIDEAASLLESIVSADPTDVPALIKLGVARMRASRITEALGLFERAVALEPDNPEALLDLAGALGKSGNSAAAIPNFEKAIEIGGRTTTALNGLGVARLESGDAAGASRAFRESLALDPQQARIAGLLRQVSGGQK
jgi:choline-sulfatase